MECCTCTLYCSTYIKLKKMNIFSKEILMIQTLNHSLIQSKFFLWKKVFSNSNEVESYNEFVNIFSATFEKDFPLTTKN